MERLLLQRFVLFLTQGNYGETSGTVTDAGIHFVLSTGEE
jgi:hypothetical protein